MPCVPLPLLTTRQTVVDLIEDTLDHYCAGLIHQRWSDVSLCSLPNLHHRSPQLYRWIGVIACTVVYRRAPF